MDKKQPNKRFKITDETVNNYGFRVLSGGGDMSGFLMNPVGLWGHNRAWRGTEDEVLPICRWEDLRLEKDQSMTALPIFDLEDEFAAKIASKVDGGFLNACSIGFQVIETSEDTALMLPGQKYPTVTKWKLKEISIVDLAGNSNAVVLYDRDGNLIKLDDDQSMQLAFGVSQTLISNTNVDMDHLKTIALLLGLSDQSNQLAIESEIKKLRADNARLVAIESELKTLKDAQTKARKDEASALLDAAVKDTRITLATRPVYEKLFDADFDSAKAALESLPTTTSLSAFVNKKLGDNSSDAGFTYNGKTFSQLQRESPQTLSMLKDNDFATFNNLYKAEFGKDYKVDPK